MHCIASPVATVTEWRKWPRKRVLIDFDFAILRGGIVLTRRRVRISRAYHLLWASTIRFTYFHFLFLISAMFFSLRGRACCWFNYLYLVFFKATLVRRIELFYCGASTWWTEAFFNCNIVPHFACSSLFYLFISDGNALLIFMLLYSKHEVVPFVQLNALNLALSSPKSVFPVCTTPYHNVLIIHHRTYEK